MEEVSARVNGEQSGAGPAHRFGHCWIDAPGSGRHYRSRMVNIGHPSCWNARPQAALRSGSIPSRRNLAKASIRRSGENFVFRPGV